jgi:hypothetical protein
VAADQSKYDKDGSIAAGWGLQSPSSSPAMTMPPSLMSLSSFLGPASSKLRRVRTADQDTSVILRCFVMIASQMMCQQDMAYIPGWFALWSPCIAPWINMVSVQICWIFLRLSKIALVACDVCNVTFMAWGKRNVAYITYIAYIACKKETLCLRLSKFLKTHQKRKARLKVCPKCFFMTTVNRFILYCCFAFLIKKRNEKWYSSYNVFLPVPVG